MDTAVVAPRFDEYDQAVMMAERAVSEALSSEQLDLNRMLTAQREINVYLTNHK